MVASSDIVLCSPLRTPVGRMGGVLASLPAADLATSVLRELITRTGLSGDGVDDVILGQGYANGESPAIGRVAALDAGLGISVSGMQVDRRCGSGLQAVLSAASAVATGGADLVVAGGVESMSNVEHYALGLRAGVRQGSVELMDRLDRGRVTAGGRSHSIAGGMIETAENLRARYGISREVQDEFAAESHRRAVAAQQEGRFAAELMAVTVPGERGRPDAVVATDEHPRADADVEKLQTLRAVRSRIDPESTVTAGNSSGQNDGAAMCVVTTMDTAERRGLTPMLALRAWAVTGCAPETMGIGPVGATAAALGRAGLRLTDLDLIELNEAFAVQVLAVLAEWGDRCLRRTAESERVGHCAGPSGWCDRRAHPRDGRIRGTPSRRTSCARDHVHRWRSGARRSV